MPSDIYNSMLRDEAIGSIDFDTDSFKIMLVTSAYAPNIDTDTRRSNVTNEVVGTGYTAGGIAITCSVGAVDTVNNRVVLTFAAVSWPASTITARGAVIYKSRGGAAANDELVCYDDFAADFASASSTFNVAATTVTKQN